MLQINDSLKIIATLGDASASPLSSSNPFKQLHSGLNTSLTLAYSLVYSVSPTSIAKSYPEYLQLATSSDPPTGIAPIVYTSPVERFD